MDDDKKALLQKKYQNIIEKFDIEKRKAEVTAVEKQTYESDFWQDSKKASGITILFIYFFFLFKAASIFE